MTLNGSDEGSRASRVVLVRTSDELTTRPDVPITVTSYSVVIEAYAHRSVKRPFSALSNVTVVRPIRRFYAHRS